MNARITLVFVAAIALCAAISFPTETSATNSWNGYHWARTANPFSVKVIDSNTPDWDDNRARAFTDWSKSTVLDLIGGGTSDDSTRIRKRCPMVLGMVRSCNASYGFNGWLGLASINVSGKHITQGSAKMNDSYFSSTRYTETNRQQVMCQEIGHTFGLDHQDESGADLNTCMDYSSALDNPSPNQHDYDELGIIYQHLDSTTTLAFSATTGSNPLIDDDEPQNWGRLVSQSADGRSSTYLRENWDGTFKATHVLWTPEFAERCTACDHRYDH